MAGKVKDKPVLQDSGKKSLGSGYIAGTNLPVDQKRSQRNSEFALLERRKTVAHYYLAGTAQWEIAKHIGVEQRVVTADLDHIRKTWLEGMIGDFDQRKAMEVAKIDMIERKMWEAYERSCEQEVIKTSERFTGFEGGTTTKQRVQKKQLIGDTRYIDKVEWCIEMRCKIFGIIKDDKREAINTNIINIAWDSIPSTGADNVEEAIRLLEVAPPAEVLPKPVEPGSELI